MCRMYVCILYVYMSPCNAIFLRSSSTDQSLSLPPSPPTNALTVKMFFFSMTGKECLKKLSSTKNIKIVKNKNNVKMVKDTKIKILKNFNNKKAKKF